MAWSELPAKTGLKLVIVSRQGTLNSAITEARRLYIYIPSL